MLLPQEYVGNELNGAFTVELSDYIEGNDIDYWINGHSHRNIDAVIGKTKGVSNQLGYESANEYHSFVSDKILKLKNK